MSDSFSSNFNGFFQKQRPKQNKTKKVSMVTGLLQSSKLKEEEDMNGNNKSRRLIKSTTDISDQISLLIQDVEEMIKIQQRIKENFRQNIWQTSSSSSLSSSSTTTTSIKVKNKKDSFNFSQEIYSEKLKCEEKTSRKANPLLPGDRQQFESYWHRLFGEIAYRLDKKIIDFVTTGIHSKLIILSVNDFHHQLKKACHEESLVISPRRAKHLYHRLAKIIAYLSQYGYSLEIHAKFSRRMQHKYGRLKNKYYCYLTNWLIKNRRNSLTDLLSSLAENQFEEENIHILYECLLALCEQDEYPFGRD